MAYYSHRNEGYFVESHKDCEWHLREQMRDQERFAKMQKQREIGDKLSYLDKCEYGDEILQHMEEMEVKTLPDVASIDIQTEIQWFMRPYLIDFLIEAHSSFQLLPETLFSTINILDRYCSRRVVYKKHYQLVGCSALMIASKYGDRKERVPLIKELKAMCCSLYEDDMFIQMEMHVLMTLDHNMGHPTADGFLQVALDGIRDPEVEQMARYICEIATFHKEFVSKRPSDMARTSLALARCILDRAQAPQRDWVSGYEQQTLVELSQHLHRPSAILSRKYSTRHTWDVAGTLDRFLARTAAVSRCYTAPPTPPIDTCADSFSSALPSNTLPATPNKRQFLPSMNNGCLTPPETPTEDEPRKFQKDICGSRRPSPPSVFTDQQPQQYPARYSLPPISQMIPHIF